jgi:hypothetical protein
MASGLSCQQIVNSEACPIDDLDSLLRQQTIDRIKAELGLQGCAVIPNFLGAVGLQTLLNEALSRKDDAYYSPQKMCNVYLGDGDVSLPENHARNMFMPRTNGFVTADLFGVDSASRKLYVWQPLHRFLAECLGKDQLFIYDDAISNMIVNVARPGQQFNWHFDTNEFTITMLLKPADDGGFFEYLPGLRSADDECYDDVKKVLDGDRSKVKRLKLNAGDLQFFLGRFSLHQVTENIGHSDRLLLIMSFTEKPGVIGNRVRVQSLYGKITDAHREQDNNRVRSDDLID